jgi:probable F420-dependent oxidoreductase
MKISLNVFNMEKWFSDDFVGMIEVARVADSAGADVLVLAEHLAMANDMAQFERRYGKAPITPFTPFMEPMVYLGAMASVTKSIKLGTSIILAPLRPALVLAKQIATLDHLSGGRAFIGIGAGWQKQEFDAVGVPWKSRYDYMVEQVRACRTLWSNAPATFHGQFINFENLNCLPLPPQGANLPLSFGIIDSDRNLAWMAEHGVGWFPMHIHEPAEFVEPIRKLKALFKARGRREEDLEVIGMSAIVFDDQGRPDLERTLALTPQYREVGVTTLQFSPAAFCSGLADFGVFLDKTIRAVKG